MHHVHRTGRRVSARNNYQHTDQRVNRELAGENEIVSNRITETEVRTEPALKAARGWRFSKWRDLGGDQHPPKPGCMDSGALESATPPLQGCQQNWHNPQTTQPPGGGVQDGDSGCHLQGLGNV